MEIKAHIDKSMEKRIEAGFIGIYACMHTVHDFFLLVISRGEGMEKKLEARMISALGSMVALPGFLSGN